MTPRAKTITINMGAAIAAVVALAGTLWGGGTTIVTMADARYVRSDSFAVRHALDSLNLRDALKDMRQHTDSVAGDLKACIRHPGDCR